MTLVVKVGGAAGNSIDPVIADLVGRKEFVLVHGGSHEVDELGSALGRPAEYYTSPSGVVSRRSDAPHLEVLVLALAGKVQTEIVAAFSKRGVRAVGLSGVDDRLLLARRKEGIRAVVDGRTVHLTDDLSGTIERVNDSVLKLLLHAGIVPVVGPPAITASGDVVNVDADRVAARVAVALGAEALLLLTNVPGLLRDPTDAASLVAHIGREEFESSLEYAHGRMRKKLLAAREARDGGVPTVVIGPSAGPAPIAAALDGHGTVFD